MNKFESEIVPHFNLKYSEKERHAAQEIKQYDAKSFKNKTIFAKQ